MDTNNSYIKAKGYIMNASRKTLLIIIAVILLIGLLIGLYFFWSGRRKSEVKNTLPSFNDTTQQIKNSAAKGVLPSLQTNALENKPDINPASKANPIKNIKTNPF